MQVICKIAKKPANLCMLSTQKQTSQIGLFSSLADILDQKHPMYQLAKIPCVPTELVAFRNRIGEPGLELILQESIRVNDPPKDNNERIVVSVDTTVQEKNITYPTDDKLYKKIIKKCWKIADKESIDLRQSYTKTFKKLSNQQRFKGTRHGAKAARKASKKIKIIAGRLIRELARKLPLESLGLYLPSLKLYQRV